MFERALARVRRTSVINDRWVSSLAIILLLFLLPCSQLLLLLLLLLFLPVFNLIQIRLLFFLFVLLWCTAIIANLIKNVWRFHRTGGFVFTVIFFEVRLKTNNFLINLLRRVFTLLFVRGSLMLLDHRFELLKGHGFLRPVQVECVLEAAGLRHVKVLDARRREHRDGLVGRRATIFTIFLKSLQDV